MHNLITIIILLLIYILVSRILGVFFLNIVGLPGAIIGRYSISKSEPKYLLGLITTLLGHVYLYLSFMVYIIAWTRQRIVDEGFIKYLIWFFCLVCAVGTIQQIYFQAKKEAIETPSKFINPQIQSLLITEVISFFSFFIFVFYPNAIEPLWTWVLKIGYPI